MANLTLTGATLVDGRQVDVDLADGRVVAVRSAGTDRPPSPAGSVLDLTGYLLTESLVEPHTHLDKAFTVDRVDNVRGTLAGAMAGYEQVLLEASPADVRARVRRGLDLLVSNGVTAVRTHVGCGRLLGLRAVEAVGQVRAEMAGLVDVQMVAHLGGPAAGTTWRQHAGMLRDAVAAGADVLGGNPSIEDEPLTALTEIVAVAAELGVPVDLHVDETTDPAVTVLRDLARLATQVDVPVTASHCVSLGALPAELAAEVAAEVAAADVRVVTLPATNLYLQGRAVGGTGPGSRGVTALDALERAGVTVAAGGDNVQDPFNPTGRLDPFETAALMVVVGHRSVESAWRMTTSRAREVLGLAPAGPVVGHVADLLAVRAGSLGEAVALAPAERMVFRRGVLISRTDVCRTGPLSDRGVPPEPVGPRHP